ncbi:MAG: hypothetical protein JJT88_00220 [Gammaproteobacteria bacterium]|nr:hypothetical protein [Gammaproteobacteria bacterium]
MNDFRPSSRPPPDDLTVIAHRPHRERNLLLTGLAAVVIAALAGWGFGRYQGDRAAAFMGAELRSLSLRHAALLEERDALERALGEVEVGQLIGSGFDEHVRGTLVEQANRIAALEDEVRIYRSIMAADDAEGLQIARLELIERIDGRGVRFRLLLVQSAEQREEISGQVELSVLGEQDGAAAVFEVDRVGDGGYPMPFRFRYFQDLVGEIELPEGFRPEGVEVIARGADPDGFLLERTFGWNIQEA